MRGKKYCLGVLLLFFISIAGCGGGGGAPGSSGSENTGIIIKSVSITDAGAEGGTGKEVDVAIHLCDPADPESGEPGLFIHTENLVITADKLNPNTASDPFPASVEQCTITYIKANSDPASPVIETMTVYPNCTLISGSNECIISLMDIQRKNDWWNDLGFGINIPAEYPTHYIATVRCKYMSNYGSSGYFQTEYDIWLADWNLC